MIDLRERERRGFRVLQVSSFGQIAKRRRNGDVFSSFYTIFKISEVENGLSPS